MVVFGIQYYIKEYLIRRFNEGFFQKPKRQVIADYQRFVKYSLGLDPVPVAHLEALHDLGRSEGGAIPGSAGEREPAL